MATSIVMVFAALCSALAIAGLAMTVANLQHFERLAPPEGIQGRRGRRTCVACVAMRNEAQNAPACLESLLSQPEISCIIVADDGSTDGTVPILTALAGRDERIVVVSPFSLCARRNGKCAALAAAAHYARGLESQMLLFIDADVRLQRGAVASLFEYSQRKGAQAVSAWPRVVTLTTWDKLFAPLVTQLLVQCLPMWTARTDPRFSAGTGQIFLVEREAYERCGGHAKIDAVVEDVALAKALTQNGSRVALASGAGIAEVMGYGSLKENVLGYGRSLYCGSGVAGCVGFAVWQLLAFAGPLIALAFAPAIAAFGVTAAILSRWLTSRRMNESFGTFVRWPLSAVASGVGALVTAYLGEHGKLTWRQRRIA